MLDKFNDFFTNLNLSFNTLASESSSIEELPLDSLVPNIWVFISHIIATVLLLFIIVWFAWKPTNKYLSDRKNLLQKEIDEIENRKLKANKFLEETKELKTQAQLNASRLREASQNEAYELKNKIETQAKNNANIIIKSAKAEIDKKKDDLDKNFCSEVSRLSIDIAEELIKTNIDLEKNKKLIDNLIKDLKDSTK